VLGIQHSCFGFVIFKGSHSKAVDDKQPKYY